MNAVILRVTIQAEPLAETLDELENQPELLCLKKSSNASTE